MQNEETLSRLKNIVANMPEQPGSYQFWDDNGTIIYVGKAKKLKARVATYFHKEVDRYKTKVLVSKIHNITYTVVKTEEDALLLENSLIKKYNPRYNVLLKDGKTYPSICVTNEPFPRIFKTRNINKKWGTYYGPYSNVGPMYAVLELIKKLFKPRACNMPMTKERIHEGKYKTCLKYHIHICDAPCVGKNYCAKSEVVSHTLHNIDVFSITNDEHNNNAFINYMHVTNGSINQAFTIEYKRKLKETDEELLAMAIPEIRNRFKSEAKEVILPFDIEWHLEGIEFTIPQRGDKKHLLELSEMNGKQYKVDRLKQTEKLNPEQRQTRLMKELQTALKMEKLPYQIECFDNSNISGADAVAACVVFKAMKPSKKDYRKYNIKTVVGPDDYASMKEVVRRRYTRMLEEGTPLPDLIITDGGKGQMEVVRQVVEDELQQHIAIAGLAKDDRHRTNELLYGFPPVVIGMKTDSELFHILTKIQDEVHRFAITFHREKRSKNALKSEIDDIKGIGAKTKETLLKTFKTAKRIKNATYEQLKEVVGPAKAQLIYDFFNKED